MEEELQLPCAQLIKVKTDENTICNTGNQEEINANFLLKEMKKESNSCFRSNSKINVDHFVASNDVTEVADIAKCFNKEEKYYEESKEAKNIDVKPEILQDMYNSNYNDTQDNKSNINAEENAAKSFTSGMVLLSLLRGDAGSSNYNRTSLSDEKRNIVTEDKGTVCKECRKSFITRYTLERHVNTVHRMLKTYQCGECHKSFSSMYHLKLHITRVHEKIKKYNCNQCEKTFFSKSDIKKHLDGVHMEVKIKCDICLKRFTQLSSLRLHISSVHKGISKYERQICNKKFLRLKELYYHVSAVHEHIKNFKCKVCSRSFSHEYLLNRHIDVAHKKIKKYCCEECIDVVHKKKKKYSCEECQNTFSSFYSLKHHINAVHMGIKCYKCNQCNKTFSYLSGLKTHIKIKHNIEINLL